MSTESAAAVSSERAVPPTDEPISARINKQLDDVASNVQYQHQREKENSQFQVRWNELMGEDGLSGAAFYRRVAVLLISWDKEDDDLNTADEVAKLKSVFKRIFNYEVFHVRLTCKNKSLPQQFLMLKLADKRFPGESLEDLSTIIWNHAESALKCTRAHVFEIFDCCYAGNLGRSRTHGFSTRSHEYLAATAANSLTKGPGPSSFTSSLIWALETLAKERKKFTTSDLANRIKDNPHFPENQHPCLSERDVSSLERIVLSPLPKDDEPVKPQEEPGNKGDLDSDRELLDLKFVLTKPPKLEEIENFAEGLKQLVKGQDIGVCSVFWGGLQSWPRGQGIQPPETVPESVHEAAHKLRKLARRRSRARSLSLVVHTANGSPSSPSLSSNASPSSASASAQGTLSPPSFMAAEPLSRLSAADNRPLASPLTFANEDSSMLPLIVKGTSSTPAPIIDRPSNSLVPTTGATIPIPSLIIDGTPSTLPPTTNAPHENGVSQRETEANDHCICCQFHPPSAPESQLVPSTTSNGT